MTGDPPGLVLLAAGGSTRLGAPKQLLPYGGIPLLRHATLQALESPCRPIVVVLGHEASRLAREIADLPVMVTTNSRWASGMASSIQTGLDRLLAVQPAVDGVVLALCDQPMVTGELLAELVRAARTSGRSMAACAYGDGCGVPAFFDRSRFDELQSLGGDTGAKSLLRTHAAAVALVPFPGGTLDVDSRADYARLLASQP